MSDGFAVLVEGVDGRVGGEDGGSAGGIAVLVDGAEGKVFGTDGERAGIVHVLVCRTEVHVLSLCHERARGVAVFVDRDEATVFCPDAEAAFLRLYDAAAVFVESSDEHILRLDADGADGLELAVAVVALVFSGFDVDGGDVDIVGSDVHMAVVDERAVGFETGDVEFACLYVDGCLGIVADVVVAVDGGDVHLFGGNGERGTRSLLLEGGAGGCQFRLFRLQGLHAAVGFSQSRHGGDSAVECIVDRG